MLIWDFQKAISLHKGYKALQIAIIIIIDVAVLHNIALFWNEPRAWGILDSYVNTENVFYFTRRHVCHIGVPT